MNDNIRNALTIALMAIPREVPDVALETYRVYLSADVTARCREVGLLSATQFVGFQSWTPARSGDTIRLVPTVYEENQVIALGGAAGIKTRGRAPVRVAEGLRREFLNITDPDHPLTRQKAPTPLVESRRL
jgi:hypothetical protein